MSQNRLRNKLSLIFTEVTFNKSEFLASTPILDTRYKYSRRKNNNSFYSFNGQLDYVLDHYFTDLETTKCNVDKFFTNSLIKPIIKNLLYYNISELIEKLSAIP